MAEATQDMTETVYIFNTDKTSRPFTGTKKVQEGYNLAANETFTTPVENVNENYWNGTAWVNKLVAAYRFDTANNNIFAGIDLIPQGSVLATNQTFVKPEDGLYQPMRFNGTIWIGTPKEEWEKSHPAQVVKPTVKQQQNALTMVDIAQLKASYATQQKLNADLMKANAQLKKNGDDQATLNANLMKQVATLQKTVDALNKESHSTEEKTA